MENLVTNLHIRIIIPCIASFQYRPQCKVLLKRDSIILLINFIRFEVNTTFNFNIGLISVMFSLWTNF